MFFVGFQIQYKLQCIPFSFQKSSETVKKDIFSLISWLTAGYKIRNQLIPIKQTNSIWNFAEIKY